jgi:DNA-binding phage protein
MEFFIKAMLFSFGGATILAVNIWFCQLIYQSFKGGDLVVAPVKIVGGSGDAAAAGETLARMLIARIKALEWDVEQSQASLQQADIKQANEGGPSPIQASEKARGVTGGVFGTPRMAGLNAHLFEPTSIDIKVGGVDVGGVLPRIQRWFVEDRTLSFSVSYQGNSAIIAGNIDALGLGKTKPLWIALENATPAAVADEIALAIIQRRWAKDAVEYRELTTDEFRKLVSSISSVAQINRRVAALNTPTKAEFEKILADVGPLAERMQRWRQLTYFAATIAEGAGSNERALTLYRRLKESGNPEIAAASLEKIKVLEALGGKDALSIMQEAAAYANEVLNKKFGHQLAPPMVALIPDPRYLNAYWDGNKINAPEAIKDIPDIIYHEAAWPHVQAVWNVEQRGQAGALLQSYTDLLGSLVKQQKLGQSAKDADWEIGPGSIAWLTGRSDAIATDRRPLRSLKAPGTAYDDPILGKDAQPEHMRDFVKLPGTQEGDYGGVHINSGIPSRAFYEAAIQIGSDAAGAIWVEALKSFDNSTDFRAAAKIIQRKAAELHGAGSREAKAVMAAWNAVGL